MYVMYLSFTINFQVLTFVYYACSLHIVNLYISLPLLVLWPSEEVGIGEERENKKL